MKRLFFLSRKERGFTLAEVIVATAIIGFVILATWRVITSSLHSITRQDQKMKALHISQAHLARLEAETFSGIVPENFIVPPTHEYQLESISYNNQIVDEDGSGDASTDDFELYKSNGNPIDSTAGWSYEPSSRTITGIPDIHIGQEIYVDYEYYHLVDEGATVPPNGESLGEGLKERTIELVTSVGDTNGNGTSGEKSDILGDDLTDNVPLSPSDYESFDPQTRELTFMEAKATNSVWVYYLPDSDTDSSGPDGVPDNYLDPTENSIVGVVAGNFSNPTGSVTNQITETKKITVTQYWKQGGQIQKAEQIAYIMNR